MASGVATKKDRDKSEAGLAGITVKGARATSTQIKNLEKALITADRLGASDRIMVCMVMTITQESNAKNLTGSGGIDFGLFSQNPAGWPASRDIAKDTTAFIKAAKRADNGQSLNDLAQAVQRSGVPNAYGQWEKEATRTVKAFQGGSAADSEGGLGVEDTPRQTKIKVKRFAFTRGGENGEPENTWDCIGRLAEEVGFRRFMSAGIFYYVSETWLFQQEVWAVIKPSTPGIDEVDFDIDFGKSVDEVTFTGRINEWAAPPGTLIELGKVYGPAADRYLISEIRTSLLDDSFSATAKKPMKKLKEPAPETVEVTPKGDKGDGEGSVGDVKGDDGKGKGLDGISVKGGGWGGTEPIFTQFIDKFMKERGLSIGGRKEGGHQAGGDHDPAVRNAFACDYGTYNGLQAAKELAAALGNKNWQPNSYATFNATIDGQSFRFQILWGAAIDHADHCHVGARSN